MTYTLENFNRMDQTAFTGVLGFIYEHSPWVAEKAWNSRPFFSVSQLHETMVNVVEEAEMDEKLNLLRAHPDLASRVEMTSESVNEQKGVGLDQLSQEENAEFLSLNQAYTKKFEFPFIMAVRGQNKQLIRLAMQERIENTRLAELEMALQEVHKIARFRLDDLINFN